MIEYLLSMCSLHVVILLQVEWAFKPFPSQCFFHHMLLTVHGLCLVVPESEVLLDPCGCEETENVGGSRGQRGFFPEVIVKWSEEPARQFSTESTEKSAGQDWAKETAEKQLSLSDYNVYALVIGVGKWTESSGRSLYIAFRVHISWKPLLRSKSVNKQHLDVGYDLINFVHFCFYVLFSLLAKPRQVAGHHLCTLTIAANCILYRILDDFV